jgi:hypothetical protein
MYSSHPSHVATTCHVHLILLELITLNTTTTTTTTTPTTSNDDDIYKPH